MTDADLRALFDAWLRDRAQVHKLAQLSGAVLRAYTEAVTQAAVRTTYPPQVRAPVSEMRLGPGTLHTDDPVRPSFTYETEAKVEFGEFVPLEPRQSPVEAPPAAEEGSAGPRGGPAEGRGGSTGDYDPFAGPPPCAMLAGKDCLPDCEFGLGSQPCARTGPAIAHADGSPLRADRLPPEVPVAEVSLTRDVREPAQEPRVCPRPSGSVCQCGWMGNIRIGPRDCMDGYRTTESDAERFARAEAMFSGPRRPRTVQLDGRGDAAPTNPADDAGDVA